MPNVFKTTLQFIIDAIVVFVVAFPGVIYNKQLDAQSVFVQQVDKMICGNVSFRDVDIEKNCTRRVSRHPKNISNNSHLVYQSQGKLLDLSTS